MPKKNEDKKWVISTKHPIFKMGKSQDNALAAAKASGRVPTRKAREAGKNDYGKIAVWYFGDARLTFSRTKHGQPYEITKVELPEDSLLLKKI